MNRLDPMIDQTMKAEILYQTVNRLRGLPYRRMPAIQHEYGVAEATVYRKRRKMVTDIYNEMSDWDPDMTEETIAQKYGIQVSDLPYIRSYAEDSFYV